MREREAEGREVTASLLEQIFQYESRSLYSEPLEEIPLRLADADNDITVPLSNGSDLIVLASDVNRLKRELPKYLHDKLKLPLHLKLINIKPVRVLIAGDRWQARVVHFLLTGELKWNASNIIGEEEVKRHLRRFRTGDHLSLAR
uniref:DUF61 family protein n=1 Tax=Fervidicoccus fontis TaxID=683846 RepID=A0A7J3ZKK2_9CREN